MTTTPSRHSFCWQDLDGFATSPRSTAEILTPPLAAWWMTASARAEVKLRPPQFSKTPGICYPILVLPEASWPHWPTLSPAVFFPLQWVPSSQLSDPSLPKALPSSLQAEALRIQNMLAKIRSFSSHSLASWHLVTAPELQHIDFSCLEMDCPSFATTLATALIVAAFGGAPNPRVFATGNLDENGAHHVGHLQQKCALMESFFGNATEQPVAFDNTGEPSVTFFVPAENHRESVPFLPSMKTSPPQIQLKTYPFEKNAPNRALQAHLHALDTPPLPGASLPLHTDYINRPYIADNREQWRQYYIKNIAHALGQEHRNQLPSFGLESIQCLFLGLGFSTELPLFLLHLYQPQYAVVLVSKETQPVLSKLVAHLAIDLKTTPQQTSEMTWILPVSSGFSMHIQGILFQPWQEETCLQDCLHWLSQHQISPKASAVETTGGTKEMSHVLVALGQQAHTHILYLQHLADSITNITYVGQEKIRPLTWLQTLPHSSSSS